MFPTFRFLSSHRNIHESLGQLEKGVETNACGSCSHSTSHSPNSIKTWCMFSNSEIAVSHKDWKLPIHEFEWLKLTLTMV